MPIVFVVLVSVVLVGCTAPLSRSAPSAEGALSSTPKPGSMGKASDSSVSSVQKQPSQVLSYAGQIRSAIRRNIAYPARRLNDPDLLHNPQAEVEVHTSPDGTVRSARLTKSSGVTDWDKAVVRAVERTAVIPLDADGKVPPVLVIAFRPR